MKTIIIFLLAVMPFAGRSQTKQDVIGKWTVAKVTIHADPEYGRPETVKQLEKMFLQTKFQFNSDGTCQVESPEKEIEVKKGRWIYNEKKKSIDISGAAPNGQTGLLMEINISTKNNKWFFGMDETPVQLEVQKTP
jgi:hypothetical protein